MKKNRGQPSQNVPIKIVKSEYGYPFLTKNIQYSVKLKKALSSGRISRPTLVKLTNCLLIFSSSHYSISIVSSHWETSLFIKCKEYLFPDMYHLEGEQGSG